MYGAAVRMNYERYKKGQRYRLGPLWAPDHRWVAPTADDRALARAIVSVADARIMADREAAEHEARGPFCPLPDGLAAARRDWLNVVGGAMCLAPLGLIAAWILRLL